MLLSVRGRRNRLQAVERFVDDAARAADDRAVTTSHSDEGSGFVDGAC